MDRFGDSVKKKIYLQTLENKIDDNPEFQDIYFKKYNSPQEIDRDGLFFSLFNKLVEPKNERIPHIISSRFEVFKDDLIYYKISNSNMFELKNDTNILMLFYLNPDLQPLNLLDDFFKNFKVDILDKVGKIKIFTHFNYHLDLSKSLDQEYLLSYFQIIEKYLGFLPNQLTLLGIEKMASFDKYLIVEAGTQWACLDNYLVHVALSKGGYLYQVPIEVSKFEVTSEYQLSPFHSIQILKNKKVGEYDIACPFLDDLKGRDFFKNPAEIKLFYYLIYKALGA